MQKAWQRFVLLLVLGYEGLGALAGGALLLAGPDGHYMKIPATVMHGAFPDFVIPGALLLALGGLSLIAFYGVLRRRRWDWLGAGLALGGWAVWFFVEIVVVDELVWLHAMWGLPVLFGMAAAVPLLPLPAATLRDLWLACGILSSLLYVAMNVVVPARWPAYDSASQTVSELSAVGAPTRPLWVVMGLVYTLLVTAFGRGVRMAAGADRRLSIAGLLIAVYGALGVVWPFAPMHLRPVLAAGGATFADTMHLALGVATELIYLLALGFAAAALGRAFRLYSLATFGVLLGFGVMTFREARAVGADLPTPLIGVWERINIGVFLLWVIVLALVLLARGQARAARSAREGDLRRGLLAAAARADEVEPARGAERDEQAGDERVVVDHRRQAEHGGGEGEGREPRI
jgi:hypothetical protein